ncbi:MAG: hypothetical protein JXR63_13230, partial [Spirochaetales bacterium]|nr:hypothetical protein [Spirochaetales bacterium]
VLGFTVETVAIANKQAVLDAQVAFNGLSDAAKAKLTNGIDADFFTGLLTKIGDLEAEDAQAQAEADTFKNTTASAALALDPATVTPASQTLVEQALAAYGSLSDLAKGKLGAEKSKLDSLDSAIKAYGRLGEWDFKHDNVLKATYGNDLVWNLSGSGNENWNKFEGSDADKAKYPGYGIGVDAGRNLKATYDIGADLTSYTLIFDMRVADFQGKCFYQTDLANSNDTELFIGKDNKIGLSTLGYSSNNVSKDKWQRVIVVKSEASYKIYIDDVLYLDSANGSDSRFTISKDGVLFLADENGEDTYMFITKIALYSTAFTDAQRSNIGATMPDTK